VLDHKRENNNATARTPEELKKIQEAVAAAIGLDTTRGDQIVVQSLPFDVPPETKPSLLTTYRGLIQPLVKYGALLLIAALVLFFVIRPAQQALKAASTSMAALPAASEAAVENLTQLSPGEAIHMTEDSKAEPEHCRRRKASRVLTWKRRLPANWIRCDRKWCARRKSANV
jgi:flagellar M-ring protein FliF